MSLLLYNVFAHLLFPFLVLRTLIKSIKIPAYRSCLFHRLGRYRTTEKRKKIWVHAVSIGEVRASVQLVEKLIIAYPQHNVLITTTTPTGRDEVRRCFGDRVEHCYVPFDLPIFIYEFISHIQPVICVLVETELWPNLIDCCAKKSIPTVMVNGRLSKKSAQGYARLPRLTGDMLRKMSLAIVQDSDAALRFVSLGMDPNKIHIGGNMKFELAVDENLKQKAAEYAAEWNAEGRPGVWIAASTHKGEEEVAIKAHKELLRAYPNTLLILVPRHAERAKDIIKICKQYDISVETLSSSRQSSVAPNVLLYDSTGDLLSLYGASDVAFIGGTLVPQGGHNPIEAAVWGLPILSGEYTYNFNEVFSKLDEKGGVVYVEDSRQLCQGVTDFLRNSAMRLRKGESNQSVVKGNHGAVSHQLTLVRSLLI